MPFGLMHTPSTFQMLMDQVLREFDFVQCYLDDVVIMSRTTKVHVEHKRLVLYPIKKHGLRLKLFKRFSAQESVPARAHCG